MKTLFLPITKEWQKEMIPAFNKQTIQHAVEETIVDRINDPMNFNHYDGPTQEQIANFG
jgi:UTP-glucose-1-phosphate uridylyltransferase